MKYCSRCLYPESHPLNIDFDTKGVCSGCNVHDEKFNLINWPEKEKEFSKLIKSYSAKNHVNYDCIIPVSGTGDDFYVVDLIKNQYGLNPLLVTYNTHYSTEVGIRNLARLCKELDCDHILYTVGPETVKKITRFTLEKMGHVYWHALAGHLTFPVQVGTKFNVPLIIWGCHNWSDQVGMFSHLDRVEMTKKVRKEHSLKMLDVEELKRAAPGLDERDLVAFSYPSDEQLEKCGVRGIYISNFFHWDSQAQIEKMIKKYGYETNEEERTFNKYETIHCNVVAGVHDYLKYLKYGYGKATDHASRDIRLKRISRSEGIDLVLKHDHIKPKNFKYFCDWLGVTEDFAIDCIDKFRDPRAWEMVDQKWIFKVKESEIRNFGNPSVELPVDDKRQYLKTKLLEENSGEFILTGRPYIDRNNFKAVEG